MRERSDSTARFGEVISVITYNLSILIDRFANSSCIVVSQVAQQCLDRLEADWAREREPAAKYLQPS